MFCWSMGLEIVSRKKKWYFWKINVHEILSDEPWYQLIAISQITQLLFWTLIN